MDKQQNNGDINNHGMPRRTGHRTDFWDRDMPRSNISIQPAGNSCHRVCLWRVSGICFSHPVSFKKTPQRAHKWGTLLDIVGTVLSLSLFLHRLLKEFSRAKWNEPFVFNVSARTEISSTWNKAVFISFLQAFLLANCFFGYLSTSPRSWRHIFALCLRLLRWSALQKHVNKTQTWM